MLRWLKQLLCMHEDYEFVGIHGEGQNILQTWRCKECGALTTTNFN